MYMCLHTLIIKATELRPAIDFTKQRTQIHTPCSSITHNRSIATNTMKQTTQACIPSKRTLTDVYYNKGTVLVFIALQLMHVGSKIYKHSGEIFACNVNAIITGGECACVWCMYMYM